MDYEIDLSTLNNKKTNLSTLKKDSEDAYSEFNSNFSSLSGTEIASLYTSLESSVQRLKTGGANSNTWYNEYITAITSLEEELAALENANLTEINEFKGKFEDMFGRVTMPVLKTGGDIHTNASLIGENYGPLGNTQASSFYELGDQAYNEWQEYTEDSARGEWIRKVGEIVKNTNTYGMKKSLIIAQIINESGWMSRHASSLSDYNNILGINTDMGRITPDMQDSTWSKKRTSGVNTVTQWNSSGTQVVPSNEDMRHYDSIEECIEDYANVVSLYHPECVGSNNLDDYSSFLEHYTPNPNSSTTEKYRDIIKKYNLERYDT